MNKKEKRNTKYFVLTGYVIHIQVDTYTIPNTMNMRMKLYLLYMNRVKVKLPMNISYLIYIYNIHSVLLD